MMKMDFLTARFLAKFKIGFDNRKFLLKYKRVLFAGTLAILSISVRAGFLEMPDTSEVPDYERDSLLLDLDIPALKYRDPNPEAGPRLNVKEFRVQGLVEYPELGVTRQNIINRVEKIRFDMMNEDRLLDSGYTPEEIAQVSDLVADIEKSTQDRHVTPVEVQRLVFLIREQRRKRGITVGMIETVADTITRYYRERGFILAKAYIPKQHVRDGVVTITLLLGKLGEVTVQNNKHYSDKKIIRIFNNSLNMPVSNSQVEENLYLVNDYPGLTATGYFESGSQIGDTKLNVNVTREKRFSSNIRLDNHGSETTGEYRAYTDFYWNNPSGLGDQLQIGVLGSFQPDNSLYGSIRYSLPIYTPRWILSLGTSNNDFVTANSSTTSTDFEVTGKSKISDIGITYKKNRTRINNQNINLNFSRITSEINFGNIKNAGTHKEVDKLDFSYDFDFLNESARVLQQGAFTLTATRFVEGEEEGQEISPYIISFDYSRLSFVELPLTNSGARWVARASGQYAGEALSEVLQFGLAGPSRARGYKITEYYADDGIYLGTDLIFNGPRFGNGKIFGEKWETAIQPFIFIDGSYGRNNSYMKGESSTDAYLLSAGLGIKLNFKNSLRGEIAISNPLDGDNSLYKNTGEDDGVIVSTTPGDGARLYFNLQYGF